MLDTAILHRLGPFDVPSVGPRHLRFYVPRTRPKKRPPSLLVLFDGQNVFDDAPAFGGAGWRAHEGVEKLRAQAPIVVALEHGGAQRLDELSPFVTARSRGLLPDVVDWLADVVVPDAWQKLGAHPEPRSVIIGGSSMGGLAAMYAHHRRPDRFGAALCMSASFWFGHGRILDEIAQTPRPLASRLYIDVGRREGRGMIEPAQRLVALLRERGYDDKTLKFRLDSRGRHDERAWRRRFAAAVRFLLRTR
jgi:predicted alpha/beta superfamily hydrolase